VIVKLEYGYNGRGISQMPIWPLATLDICFTRDADGKAGITTHAISQLNKCPWNFCRHQEYDVQSGYAYRSAATGKKQMDVQHKEASLGFLHLVTQPT
jgi:hypothetical protein